MPPLPAIKGSSPLDVSDDVRLLFTNNTNGEILSRDLDNTPADFVSMADLRFKIEYRQQGRSDDTLGLHIRISDSLGTTHLAPDSAAGDFDLVSSNVTSTTDGERFNVIFTSLLAADKSVWDGAKVFLKQTYTQNMGADGCHVEVDYVELTGRYLTSFPITDSFTEASDTDLVNHISESGAYWIAMNRVLRAYTEGGSATARVVGNQLISNSSTGNTNGYLAEVSPDSAEYNVLTDFIVGSVSSALDLWELGARCVYGSGSANTHDRYVATYEGNATASSRRWALYKLSGGTVTLLNSFAEDLAPGTYRVKFEVLNATKKLYVWNGTQWVTKLSSTDNAITAKGVVGVGVPRNTSGNAIDNLTTIASDPPPAVTAVGPPVSAQVI